MVEVSAVAAQDKFNAPTSVVLAAESSKYLVKNQTRKRENLLVIENRNESTIVHGIDKNEASKGKY